MMTLVKVQIPHTHALLGILEKGQIYHEYPLVVPVLKGEIPHASGCNT